MRKKPYVGAIVQFVLGPKSIPQAALVSSLDDENPTTVNLMVFMEKSPVPVFHVRGVKFDEACEKPCTWRWPY